MQKVKLNSLFFYDYMRDNRIDQRQLATEFKITREFFNGLLKHKFCAGYGCRKAIAAYFKDKTNAQLFINV
jgi:sugar phosphate permease